jgi:hypothetical protein
MVHHFSSVSNINVQFLVTCHVLFIAAPAIQSHIIMVVMMRMIIMMMMINGSSYLEISSFNPKLNVAKFSLNQSTHTHRRFA